MDAITLLKQDHRKVKKMLADLEATTERAVRTREEIYAKLTFELTVHEQIEETLLYPLLKEHDKTKEIALEAYEEHNVVDMVMGELDQTPYDDETWGAKLTVMKENLEHHIEEEEGDMFKKARQILDQDALEALGAQMEEMKAKAKSEAA